MKKRLEEIKYRMWEISMADYIRGDERIEYEALKAEKMMIEAEMVKEDKE